MRRMRSASDSDDTRSRFRSTTSGNPNGVTRFGCLTTIVDRDSRSQRRAEPRALELTLEHFARGLRQQQVAGIVLPKHVEEQTARHLQLTRGLPCPRKSREHETGHARELAELSPRHLGRIERGLNVLDEVVGTEERRLERGGERRLRRRHAARSRSRSTPSRT